MRLKANLSAAFIYGRVPAGVALMHRENDETRNGRLNQWGSGPTRSGRQVNKHDLAAE